MEKQQTIKSR